MNIATTGALWLLLALPGQTSAAEPIVVNGALVTAIAQTDVPARAEGVLTKLHVVEGQSVKLDELLAEIDSREAELLLAKAEAEAVIAATSAKNDADLRYARKSAEVAKAELKRSQESIERFERSISQTELDKMVLEAERGVLAVESAEHELEVARQTLALKQAEVQVARETLARRRLSAPTSGVVTQLHRRSGEWVKPGDVVLRLMRVDPLRIEGFVSAATAARLKPGMSARFQAPISDEPSRDFVGKLTFVSPEVDPVNGEVRLFVEVNNRELLLRPGLRGTLTIDVRPAVNDKKASQE
ncbi:MAG: efflux RND transporter periplasmic adaptor subunit [Planctomycetales bacterium]|nr:efflux RND transporter periplasmic adaptor subunit [Planctomycetales bacterium]MBN8626446.1 efflux RND transporter periplasmic adaptor subunit [Planctomycetota bacterium]